MKLPTYLYIESARGRVPAHLYFGIRKRQIGDLCNLRKCTSPQMPAVYHAPTTHICFIYTCILVRKFFPSLPDIYNAICATYSRSLLVHVYSNIGDGLKYT